MVRCAYGDREAASWSFLTDVEVSASSGAAGIAELGDLIIDGHGSTVDADHRRPDLPSDPLPGAHGRPDGTVSAADIEQGCRRLVAH